MIWTPPPAKWETWKHVGECELWKAVILTLGHDPRFFDFHRESGSELIVASIHLVFMPQNAAYQTGLELVDAIHERLMIAKSKLDKDDGIRVVGRIFGASPSRCIVDLSEFWAWATKVWPNLPFHFPEKSASGTSTKTDAERPLSTRERDGLLVVIAALAKKSDVHVDQPTVSAKEIVRVARDDLGTRIGVRTVEEILKQIDGALDRKASDRE